MQYHLESTSTAFLYEGLPALARTCFFAFFLSLRAPNSFRVVRRRPSLTVKVSSSYLLKGLYYRRYGVRMQTLRANMTRSSIRLYAFFKGAKQPILRGYRRCDE
ncbi:hypothetical protein HBI01_066130 [Parastagonospora nodorum]|nr:hypothetical protein HBI01_066130 [Parastagonospora nodorum]KAH4725057.1 hypothetical protein HBH66_108350 [Parastagonospora nodorum]